MTGLLPKSTIIDVHVQQVPLGNTGVTPGTYNNADITVLSNGLVSAAAANPDPVLSVTGTSGVGATTVGQNVTVFLSTVIGSGGRVAIVDSVNGNDGTASVNGLPFLTIQAALTAAGVAAPAQVIIRPGTYTQTAALTIPPQVYVRGVSAQAVIVRWTGATGTAYVFVMGDNTRLEDLTIEITATAATIIGGILFPDTSASTAAVRTVRVLATSTDAGGTNVYAVRSNGTGVGAPEVSNLRASTVIATAAGTGSCRALLVDTGANTFYVRDCFLSSLNTDAGTSIAAQVNFAGANLILRTSSFSGTGVGVSSDLSQSAGTLQLGAGSTLLNSTANSLPITVQSGGTSYTFGDTGALTAAVTRYYYTGTAPVSANEVSISVPTAWLCFALFVRCRVAPTTRSDVFTVRRNGAATALTVTIAAGQTTGSFSGASQTFSAGDALGLQVVSGAGGTAPSDYQIVVFGI